MLVVFLLENSIIVNVRSKLIKIICIVLIKSISAYGFVTMTSPDKLNIFSLIFFKRFAEIYVIFLGGEYLLTEYLLEDRKVLLI